MSADRFVAEGKDAARVSGALTFQTAQDYLADSRSWLSGQQGTATIDLSGVSRVDSAGIALLLEWLRLARERGRDVHFTGVPDQVRHLIQVNGLARILPGLSPA